LSGTCWKNSQWEYRTGGGRSVYDGRGAKCGNLKGGGTNILRKKAIPIKDLVRVVKRKIMIKGWKIYLRSGEGGSRMSINHLMVKVPERGKKKKKK